MGLKYLIMSGSDAEDSNEVLKVIEKPSFKDAPSNLASIGRYVLTSEIFQH